jgi:hypothetical protein
MLGEDAKRARSEPWPRARARLLACFALAVTAHAAALVVQPAGKQLVASRRSAGGFRQIELDEGPPGLPLVAVAAAAASFPVFRRDRDVTLATRAPAAVRAHARHTRDQSPRSGATETTNLVAGPADTPTSIAGGSAAVAGSRASSEASFVSTRPRSAGDHPRGPRLLTTGVCAGFFPPQARDDDGAVIMALGVHESGTPYAPRVISESPPRQGFASAALRCASLLKFAPAQNATGAHVSSISVVRLRFARAAAR